MQNPIRISVVIPAYNAGIFLQETIESVLAQTMPPHEIIVVDDGSTDNTAAICFEYKHVIRYIHQQNRGQSEARNTGIRIATGGWIALLDSDDIALPERIQCTAESIHSHPRAIVHYTAFEYFYADGIRRLEPAFPAKKLWPALRYRTPILPSTATISRSALMEVGLFRKVAIEDWDLWFRLVLMYGVPGFQEIPESLLLYRRWEGSYSTQHLKISRGMLELMDDILLKDLSPLSKYLWRRRIEARIHHELSVELRNHQDPIHINHALLSLKKWPLFGDIVPARRYKIVANMLYNYMRSGAKNRARA